MADSVTISETSYIVQVTPSAPDNVTISEDVTNITITEVLGDTVTVTTPAAQQVTIASSASLSLQTLTGFTTDDLAEGSNLYYTDARASAAAPVQDITMPLGYTVTNSLGDYTISVSNASQIRQDIGADDAANLTTGNIAAARVGQINITAFKDVSSTLDKSADNILYTNGTTVVARNPSNWSLTDFTNDLTSGDLPAHTHAASEITSGSLSIDLIPSADLTYSIGTDAARWADIHGDLDGAVTFRAKNASGGTLTVGDIVYISGVSGSVPTVDLADCSDPAKMPAFGMVRDASVNPNAETHIATLGSVEGVDVPSGTYTLGSNVYVGTAGTFTDSPPTGEGNLIQNIGWVARVNPGGGPAGIIKVGGAGRTNAVPNLNEDRIFLGNASNQAASTALSSINLSKFNNDLVLADDNYKITPKSGTVKLFDDMQSLYPLFGTQSGYWTQLAGIYNDHHGVVRGYTANQSWRRANIDVEPMIGRTVGEEALCEVYFDPDLRSNGAEISFGCWFGDGTEGLQSTISGSGWGDICHVGLTCYGNPALPYWRRFHRDNEGTYQNSSESDLLSFAFTNNQWVRLGLHCKRAELLGIEYWEVTAYIDGTQAFTQNIYTDTGCPGFTIMLYNNADAVTSYYHVDWINYEYSGRGTTVTHLNLEDL